MHHRYVVSGRVEEAMLTITTVFSAPKYCDTTENKGAYINIGPDLKLDYHQFEAVPHPDIKPMVSASPDSYARVRRIDLLAGICNQQSVTEHDVISSLGLL